MAVEMKICDHIEPYVSFIRLFTVWDASFKNAKPIILHLLSYIASVVSEMEDISSM
jgi:hypothetical protein